jgi:class 3 adenylate cyclase/predicted ATPase
MTFEEILNQAIAMLQRRGRVTYGTLQLQFQLEAEHLAVLKEALLFGHPQIMEEEGRGLVWIGDAPTVSPPTSASPQPLEQPVTLAPRGGPMTVPPFASQPPDAERRQLTVLFCDLVDSTPLASQLDPEDLREVVRAYQDTCAKVIARYEGYIAQYLGDGLLVYFGYPLAHEDDAQRAVRAGLGIVEALGQLNMRLEQERRVHLAVRLGIHTGLVVVGEVGSGTRQEQLALGETPNIAARLQGIAVPNTLVISAATFHLLGGFFACQPLGTSLLKGLAQPLAVYRVLYESMARSRLEAAGSTGWTPLVGREQEIGLLRERWAQVKDGVGQVVLLSGEAGIGKSRLVQVLTAQVASEPQAWLTPCQCSPYYQHTALYPMIDLLERVALRFEREDSSQQKLRKLEGFLVQYGLRLAEAVPLFAALLSLPLPADYPPLPMSPEQQRQQTLRALLAILVRIAAQQPVLFVMEDLHWIDPSTLELLTLLIEQGPTARILVLLTFRPDFNPPWRGRTPLTQVTLPRLPRCQASAIMAQVAHGKVLPPEVVEQVVAKTDGVPLFVEELTKMVLESGLLQEWEERYELTGPLPPLAIPATLHDSLMARLDRLAIVKALAQLGATLGREFSYELLQAVSLWDEDTFRRGLHQLVEAEFLYQQGLPPQATYVFKHALIQDAAYQSLLKRTRQQYHLRIAQVVEGQFAALAASQPEVVAHHYTEAERYAEAIPYWHSAGQRAMERSAHLEAITHFSRGRDLLQGLPDSPERLQQELTLQIALGVPLMATRGYAAPEAEQAYSRARELCQQAESRSGVAPSLLFPVLHGLWRFYLVRGNFQTAHELGEQLLALAQSVRDPGLLLEAHMALAITLFWLGELASALAHAERGIALYEGPQHHTHAFLYGQDPGVACRCYAAWTLWHLGYPHQGLQRLHEALTLADELSHPYTQCFARGHAAMQYQHRQDVLATRAQAEAAMALATEQGFLFWLAWGKVLQGWSLAESGQSAEGIAQMRQSLATWQVIGAGIALPYALTLLTAAYGKSGQLDEALATLTAALTASQRTGERFYEAELHRLQGQLCLQTAIRDRVSGVAPQDAGAEACFQQALTVARQQGTKSLELRAAASLARFWRQQGKRAEAHALLAPIYGWFTEGFDTAALQEAKVLLEELA